MHEVGVARRLAEVVNQRAAQAGAAHVRAVHMEIGEESDVAPGSLELYWPDVTRDTPAEGARLLFVAPPDEPFACRVVAIDAD
ncbi:MAG: hydrogenase maturation nickel metallochaperone HypA [Chloroflexota bacterium]